MTVTESTTTADRRQRTTGWEPDLATDDTLVRQFVSALATLSTDVARAMGGRVLEGDGVIAVDLGAPNAILNAAVLTKPPGRRTRRGTRSSTPSTSSTAAEPVARSCSACGRHPT